MIFHQVNQNNMTDELEQRPIIIKKVKKDHGGHGGAWKVAYADFVTSTTHKTLRGPRGGLILCKSKYAKQIDSMVFPGIQGGPFMHIIAAKAVAFKEAMSEEFKICQKQKFDKLVTRNNKDYTTHDVDKDHFTERWIKNLSDRQIIMNMNSQFCSKA